MIFFFLFIEYFSTCLVLFTGMFAEHFSPGMARHELGLLCHGPCGVWACPETVQLEMLVPAGLPHRNTVRSKVLQGKFRKMSGKSPVDVPERDPCHRGGKGALTSLSQGHLEFFGMANIAGILIFRWVWECVGRIRAPGSGRCCASALQPPGTQAGGRCVGRQRIEAPQGEILKTRAKLL